MMANTHETAKTAAQGGDCRKEVQAEAARQKPSPVICRYLSDRQAEARKDLHMVQCREATALFREAADGMRVLIQSPSKSAEKFLLTSGSFESGSWFAQ